MPIYEYECQKCGEVFEVMQKFDDPPPKKHECGSRKVRKVMSQSSFVLKGSGWYVTDYARKGKKDSDSKSEKKSESKSTTSKKKGGAAA